MKRLGFRIAALCALLLALSATAGADEGMYTFDSPPLKIWKDTYGFQPDQKWLDHAMMASVRLGSGGSGSFVSGDGLVMTNHHVGFDCIQKLSTPEKDYVSSGFIAPKREEEAPCPDLELNVMVSSKDVTSEMTKAAAAAKDDAEAAKLRKAESARLEKECSDLTGLRCNVVALYGGGQYAVYRFRRHTDVRLVFAPEQQIAFFGGDFDNFTYPRFDMDVTLLRVYEKGKPYHPEHFFKWSKAGAQENELTFVIGNPGSTGRQLTVSQLEFHRDLRTPNRLRSFGRILKTLKDYASKSDENLRQAKQLIFEFENAVKAYKGYEAGLKDPEVFKKKIEEEKALRSAVKKVPETEAQVKDSWKKIEAAMKDYAAFHVAQYLGDALVGRSELLRRGVMIIQMVAEKKKPNEERYEEYRDSALESAELDLYSAAPIYKELEKAIIRSGLEEAVEVLGKDHPLVKAALDGKAPAAVAAEAVGGTQLYSADARKELIRSGDKWKPKKWDKNIRKSKDPVIRLALRLDPVLRELRKRYEDTIKSVEETEGQKIAAARFKVYGKDQPPDATFTPRISFGVVKGFDAEGTIVPFQTNFYGLYGRSAAFGGKPPFDLPPRWLKRKGAVDMNVPLNFVLTADIIGGNSGSPVVNKKGEIVGLIFDGNIESLVLRYVYTEVKARAVAVSSEGIREALLKIFEAPSLAKELGAEATQP